MPDHEGFSLAPRDIIWPALFALGQTLIAFGLGAFQAGAPINAAAAVTLLPAIVLLGVAFGAVDALTVVFAKRSRREVAYVFGIDIAVWFGCVALLVVADSGPLTWWRFVLPVLAGATGASMLDQGRGRGVMIATCVVILAALGMHATGSALDWASIPPSIAWPTLAVMGTFPFCAYLRLTHRRGTSLHLAGSITSAALAMALAFTVTWALAVESPAAHASEMLLQRQQAISAITTEIGQRFSVAQVSQCEPIFTQAFGRYSSAAGADLYLVRLSGGQSSVLVASHNVPQASNPGSVPRVDVACKTVTLAAEEGRAVRLAADSAGMAVDGLSPAPGTSRARLTKAWRYAGGPPLAEKVAALSGQPAGASEYVLVVAAGLPNWWQTLSPVQVAAASAGSIFPWLFYGLLLPVMASLLIVSRRTDMRRRLIEAEERSRIDLDAHDKVYNRLSAIAKIVEMSSKPAEDGGPMSLGAVADDIRSTVADLQRIVGDKPPEAVPGGVRAQLEDVSKAQALRLDMSVTFHAPDDLPELPVKLRWDLQCVLEEALTNAAKHGAARHVDVSLGIGDQGGSGGSSLRLTVSDDGTGTPQRIDIDRLPASRRGLRGIRDRAAARKGEASLESQAGRTVLSFDVPIK